MKGVFLDVESMGEGLVHERLQNALRVFDAYATTQQEEVVSRLKGADVAIVNKVVIGREQIEQSPDLKLIAVTATGTNNIDLEAARERGVRVCNVIQYGRPTIVQHTFSLILALANNLLGYAKDVQAGYWQHSPVFCMMNHPIVELEGKTMGVIGYGDLGQGVAKMAEAFGMNVMVGARPGQAVGKVDGFPRISLDELLPQVDVLSIHCLLSDETKDLIDVSALASMKSSAFLVNVARGGIVNEVALANALKAGEIAGAATDVLSVEPPREGNVLLDPDIPNLIVTPHCAWASRESRQRLLDKTADNIELFVQGRLERYIV